MENLKTEDLADSVTIPLSEVTVYARSRKAFDFLNRDITCTGLLLSTCQQKLRLKEGEKFPKPQDLTQFARIEHFEENIFDDLLVLQCKPLYIGSLSLKTQIILVDKCDSISGQSEVPSPMQQNEVPVLSEFLLNLSVSNSSSSIGNVLDRIVLNRKDAGFQCANLKLFLNFDKFHGAVIHNHVNSVPEIDMCNTLLLAECSVNKCKLYDGDWVEIKLKSESKVVKGELKSHVCQVRVVQEIVSGEGQDSTSFFALPHVFYGLKIQDLRRAEIGIEIIYRRYQCAVSLRVPECSISGGGAPPSVKEVHISCVHSPTYSPGDSYKQLLQNFFTTSRVVKVGTVFSIDTKDDPEYWQNVTEISEMRKPVLYFKVNKLHPKINGCKFYIANSRETSLYLDGTVQSFVPTLMSHAFRATKTESHVSPPGLEEDVDHIISLVFPYVQQKQSIGSVYPSVLLSGPPGCGKTAVVAAVCGYLNMHCYQVNCHELCGETSGATEARIKHTLQRAYSYAPCVILLRNIEALGKDRDGNSEDPRVASSFIEQVNKISSEQVTKSTVVLIASTSFVKALSTDMQEGFLHHVEIGSPNESRRTRMLSHALSDLSLGKDVSVKHIAQRTAGMVLGDIQALVSFVKKVALERITTYCKSALGRSVLSWKEEESIQQVGYPLCNEDFSAALDHLQATHSDSLGAPKIPNVKWEDIGGLASVKSEILDTVQLPLQHPELFASGMRRSGVLLYGPPGTGKTLLAKAVATECSLNFLNVKGPELINMYVGQSEENIREVFQRARNASPCVIFFDELDSLAPNRGRSGDSGGVMDRVVSQLLAELDGLHKAADVFVIGATNRPDLLDPALLRPGRFDKLLYLGVSEDRISQMKILDALTRKFTLEKSINLAEVVELLPHNLTGADLYAFCSDAMLNALKSKIDSLDRGEVVDQSFVEVTESDFRRAADSVVPSVSLEELQHYKAVQAQFNTNQTTI